LGWQGKSKSGFDLMSLWPLSDEKEDRHLVTISCGVASLRVLVRVSAMGIGWWSAIVSFCAECLFGHTHE
jgi:hypothetical protein